jgi:hypothetical protein
MLKRTGGPFEPASKLKPTQPSRRQAKIPISAHPSIMQTSGKASISFWDKYIRIWDMGLETQTGL